MKKAKRFVCFFLSLIMLVGLFGCGLATNTDGSSAGSSTSNSSVSKSSDTNYAVTIHHLTAKGTNDPTTKTFVDLMNEFGKSHPGFKYEVESVSDRPSFLQKVKILASSDELPDFFDSDPDSFLQTLVSKGAVANIDDLYSEIGVSDRFYKVCKDYGRLDDGSLYLMNFQGNTEYFWYNKDIFKKLNIEIPKTFNELLSVCEKIKNAGVTPIAMGDKDSWPLLRYYAMVPFRTTGNDYINNLRVGKAKMSDPDGTAAMDFVSNITKYFNVGWATADYNTMIDLYTSQKAAMLYMGTWQLSSFVDPKTNNLYPYMGYFKLPKVSDKDKTTVNDFWAHSGIGTAINKKSLTPAVKEAIKYLAGNYADTALYKYNAIPGLKPTIKDSLSPVTKGFLDDLLSVNTYAMCWDVRVDSATNDVLGKEAVNYALGNITKQQFAKTIDDAISKNAAK